MNLVKVWELFLASVTVVCKLVRWITGRKPTRGTVLIVEDDPDDIFFLQQKLDKIGWGYRVARDGHCAECMVLDRFFEVAIIDLRLPGLPSIEVVQRIQEHSPRTRVAVMTHYPYLLKMNHLSIRVMSKDIGVEPLRKWLEK